jgi:hypothetical protein
MISYGPNRDPGAIDMQNPDYIRAPWTGTHLAVRGGPTGQNCRVVPESANWSENVIA